MKKRIGIVVVMCFMLLGTSTLAGINTHFFKSTREKPGEITMLSRVFSLPTIKEDGQYVIIENDDSMTRLMSEGFPLLPRQTEVIVFPVGTTIESIKVTTNEVQTIQLSKKIKPASKPIPSNMKNTFIEIKEGEIYASTEMYPSEWFTSNIGAGIHNGEHAIFLSIHLYPYRYIPTNNELLCANEMDIKVTYAFPEKPLLQNDAYDLVIIAPPEFIDGLQPLVQHKENYGINAQLVALDEIYSGTHFTLQGRDDAEKIKYFIKNALEEWGIHYVLLVGGRHGGLFNEKWWCPVRYSHLEDNSDEKQFLSDLYFSDVYKYDSGNIAFDNWDSNGNGIYAEWRMFDKDIIDMYPDVYIGRLPCRNTVEVTNIVEKIIAYETTTYGQNWFNKFVGVGGDTYPTSGSPYYEGELATEAAFTYLDDFEAEFLWTSTGTLSGVEDVITTVSQGCGFLHFSGHGNPMGWSNNLPEEETRIKGLYVYDMPRLSNKDMYPICVVGGCHNNQFNVSLLNLLKIYEGLKEWYYNYIWVGDVSPECWGWWLARKIDGGSIATIANSGYGYGQPGETCLEYRGRYMELQFFRSYSEGKDMLGGTHTSGLTYYLNKFPPLTDRIDSKIVQQWVLLGDPSLKIGGYP